MNATRLLLAALICCTFLIGGRAHATEPRSEELARLDDTLLVRFEAGTSAAERGAIVQRTGGHVIDQIDALNIAVVRVPRPGDSALHTMSVQFDQHASVVYAAPNIRFEIADDTTNTSDQQRILIPIVWGLPGAWTPNDPEYAKQKAYWDRINAPGGWGITGGASTVVIAIVDTGVQLNHPDLRSKLVAGVDFVGDRQTPSPRDGHGHGTHVAGIAAATTNNHLGVAGTCPNCKLMPVRVLNDWGIGDLVAVAKGIVWAVDRGAKIINLSLVGPEDHPALNDAITYAWNKGALPVCAAGNRNSNNPAAYPASYSRCFTVGATTELDQKASFSNYGPWVAIAAPGDSIYSTTCQLNSYGFCSSASSYDYNSGTSMAAPIVAGVAGLLADTGMTNEQLRQRICSTADPIASTGSYWTCGRLNVFRAVANR